MTSCTLVALLALFLSYLTFSPLAKSPTQDLTQDPTQDRFAYQLETENQTEPTENIRTGVSKDLWIAENNHRLHHRIDSPSSTLTVIQKGDSMELIEHLVDMKCYLQEKIEDNYDGTHQHIRYLESESGSYHYSSQLFDANSVFLALFRLQGSNLDTNLPAEDAYLQGIAQEVSLRFSDPSPDCHAKKFKAHITPSKSP